MIVISTLATSRSTVSRSQTSNDGIGEERVNEEGYKLKTIIYFYFLIWKKTIDLREPGPCVVPGKNHSLAISN